MKVRPKRIERWLLCGLVLVPAGGCAVMSDVLSPGLLAQLGIDPATIVAPQGTVIVAFKNETQFPADFFAFESADARDLTRSSRNFSMRVDPNQVGNEVIDCPVGLISPGSLGANFAISTQAVNVLATGAGGGAAAQVAYAGQPLENGTAFVCGDIIEIRLVAAAGGTQAYQLIVRVIR